MDKNITAIMPQLNELYKIYETYAWHSNDRKIVVIYSQQTITFYLYDKNTLADEFHLVFPQEEKDLYEAISLNLFVKMLGNTRIHKLEPNMYHNPYHKSYLLVIAEDQELQTIMDNLIIKQKTEDITLETSEIKEVNLKIKRRKYNQEFIDLLAKRVYLSDVMLREWDK